MLDATHEASLTSWVESANDPATPFPIQNLPFGVFRLDDREPARCGIAIGDQIFSPSEHLDLFHGPGRAAAQACSAADLLDLLRLGPAAWSALRLQASAILSAGYPNRDAVAPSLCPRAAAAMLLPVRIGNFTDFFASVFHATNAGRIFRPDTPLLPNYKYVPVAYHGRASSVVVSGSSFRRPKGQLRPLRDGLAPRYEATAALDFEAELGVVIGVPSELGQPVSVAAADRHIFGLCILNDWTARDIQAWEAQPLGPFLGKNFASTISPWIVTLGALEPFRGPAYLRPDGDPAPLPHLCDDRDQGAGGFVIDVVTAIRTEKMVQDGEAPVQLSAGAFSDSYWTLAQMVAHHTSNGCNLQPGDLIGTGTISGSEPESWGSLIEKTFGGRSEIRLPNGQSRRYLEDFDEIVMTAHCERAGWRGIGFGECRGTVLPALAA